MDKVVKTEKFVENDNAAKAILDPRKESEALKAENVNGIKKLFDIKWCQGWHWDIGGDALSLDLHYGLQLKVDGKWTC